VEPNIPEAKSALMRATPAADATAVANLTADNADFAALLQLQIGKDGGNVVFSPHSISTALAMTYAGARGTTAAEMASALNFRLPDAQLHDAFNALDAALDTRAVVNDDPKKALSLDIANAVFTDKTLAIEAPFLDLLALNYGTGVKLLDFLKAAEQSRSTINQWVEAKTRNKIKDLLGKGAVTESTRLVLVNAISLKAAWSKPFLKEQTADATFSNRDGTTRSVPFMHQTEALSYGTSATTETVELAYVGEALAMTFVLPKAGENIEADTEWVAHARATLTPARVDLRLPKFELEPDGVSLKPTLQALGMKAAFDGADFSGISAEPLVIDDVIHKAYLAVDEEGTEAAAATAVTFLETSAPAGDPVSVTFDRPFLFAIVDRATGAVLFQGRVNQL